MAEASGAGAAGPAATGGGAAPTHERVPRRVVSGMRPTGKLHLGHYHGALKNWIALSRKAECFFFSVDWHALTTDYKDPSGIAQAQRDMFADWIAAGLDPERCTLFIQSHVKQHAELFLLLSMIAPVGWLERVPTYKELQEQLREKELNTYGFLGYPVLQTADIALYRADAVPVGQDQVSHLELARELVRRFNHLYAKHGARPVLVEPHPYLTEVPKILGLDGRKMSKSYGNAVELGEDPASAKKRIMVAVTDPARKRRNDPGHPEVCPIFHLHRAYSTPERVELVDRECRSAGIGCVDCKKMLLESLVPALEQHRAARAELDRNPGRIDELVQVGTQKARLAAETTMEAVREAMHLGARALADGVKGA
ncbi:MAG TPA: tryptophan--tRNA ligase [Myxococcales bacterium]|nr:tryptophan--tRNA ligase [Myxococcales bacterium]